MEIQKELLLIALEAALKAGKETLKFYAGEFDVLVKEDHSPLTQADLEANRKINEVLKDSGIPLLSEENKLIPYRDRKNWKQFWLIDPLDGTKEFINQSSEYTVNIALIEKGVPSLGVVYAPALQKVYFSERKLGSFKAKIQVDDKPMDILHDAKLLSVRKPHKNLRVVASRSHISNDTKAFIRKIQSQVKVGEMKSYGSSLKLCMVAEGSADIYPRLGRTMEWDTAASHAVAVYAGCKVLNLEEKEPLHYNKENLLNPWFIVYNAQLQSLIESII
jgi:3'(2'), 5'-bisphosphate nucleotidase